MSLDGEPKHLGDDWEVSGVSPAGLRSEVLAGLTDTLEADQRRDFHSLLIARGGRLVFERYFNGYDARRLHDIRSAGKSFTSTLVGAAVESGLIHEQDLVLPYFQHHQSIRHLDRWKRSIRIHHLLTMMSGFDADDSDLATPGCEENMLKSEDWVRHCLDLPMREAPGQNWVYAGANAMLLAGLLEVATGQPFLDFAVNTLFEPLGIHQFEWAASPQGVPAGQGFLGLCGRDMLKLGQLYLNGGKWLGQQVVSQRWVDAATRRWMKLPHQENAGYGYQWWCNSFELEGRAFDCYFASGNGGNRIYVIPSLDMVVAMASSAYQKPYMHLRSFEALRQVVFAAV